MGDLKTWLLVITGGLFVIYCVMPLVLFALTAFFVSRYLKRLAAPDVAEMQEKYAALRAANPGLSDDRLVRKIIHQQAFKCGVVGAITGFGGFVTLPIALPVDILASMRIQATMVQFIAATYGYAEVSEQELQIRTHLVMAGGARATQATTRFSLRFALRFVSISLAKFVPLIGAAISFAVNYAFAQATGNIAQQWYSGRLAQLGGGPTRATLPPGGTRLTTEDTDGTEKRIEDLR
jgi:uncharacterized protein (DUF697 family)